jgi:uncharacterized membrane protein YvlD (DUF360 family)
MKTMERAWRAISRFAAFAILEALLLLLIDRYVPGVSLAPLRSLLMLVVVVAIASLLVLGNALARPLLAAFRLPVRVLTLGLSGLVVNASVLCVAHYLWPSFVLESWQGIAWGGLILAAANVLMGGVAAVDDDVVREKLARQLGQEQGEGDPAAPTRGLAILEIDGLSCPRMRRAVEQGLMPAVRERLSQGTHVLSQYDCGLPSQTSAAQAGILYGDNFDIPAFRWYDKDKGKLVVSNHLEDAAEIDARYARGHGLLRGGSSINNLMTGDARKTLFTLSVLSDRPEDMARRSLEDLYRFWLNPYLFARSVFLALWDLLVEFAQEIRQRARNIQPRLNRLQKAFPLRRAVANVLLRDLGTFVAITDITRGLPAIYVSYVGYDEIAHHAGPDTPDAMKSLHGVDKQVRRVWQVIQHKAPRPYDLIVISDHGQSSGATFKQRYGQTLTDFIVELVEERASVAEVYATEDSQGHAEALLAEIEQMEQSVAVGGLQKATLSQARRAVQRRLDRHMPPMLVDGEQVGVVVCVSGNLANVYFDLHAGKVGMHELEDAYPGLLDALVAHPGIGFVVAHAEDGVPWALGKQGVRDLETGAVDGDDPLLPYGDPGMRAAQLLRLARFPHAGDLIVNSTLYEDGQVAAFEELVGSHGGLGGQQTEAFMLHPADMVVPPTSNATDVFGLLIARRGQPVAAIPKEGNHR